MEMFNHILKPSKVRYLNTAFLAYLSEVGLSHLAVTGHLLRNDKVKHCHTKNSTTVLLVSLLATCQPSYAEMGKSHFGGNSDFVEQLNKISYLPSISEDFSLISNSDFVQELNKINQLPVFDSFNCIDKVAVASNNQVLSKFHSVPPLRHSGFFAPIVYAASQAHKYGSNMTMARLRPKSVYDWMTRPNKPMANKSGGSVRPRVNPVALIPQINATSLNSKLTGVAHHG